MSLCGDLLRRMGGVTEYRQFNGQLEQQLSPLSEAISCLHTLGRGSDAQRLGGGFNEPDLASLMKVKQSSAPNSSHSLRELSIPGGKPEVTHGVRTLDTELQTNHSHRLTSVTENVTWLSKPCLVFSVIRCLPAWPFHTNVLFSFLSLNIFIFHFYPSFFLPPFSFSMWHS